MTEESIGEAARQLLLSLGVESDETVRLVKNSLLVMFKALDEEIIKLSEADKTGVRPAIEILIAGLGRRLIGYKTQIRVEFAQIFGAALGMTVREGSQPEEKPWRRMCRPQRPGRR